QPAEHECEYHHREKRPQDRPQDPDHSLLVANQNVAPRQKEKQFAESPEVHPIVALHFAGSQHDLELLVAYLLLQTFCHSRHEGWGSSSVPSSREEKFGTEVS